MKRILFVIIATFVFASCEDGHISNGRKLYKMYFQLMLKDPESFVVYKEEFRKEGEVKVEWTIEYGARNGFGGMVREKAEFSTIGDMLFIEGSAFEREKDELIIVY